MAVFLLVIVLASGCVRRESGAASAAPTPTAEPAPTATPAPTPVPYDLAAETSEAEFSFAADYKVAEEALLSLREAAEPDQWDALFPDGAGIEAPEASRLLDRGSGGDSIYAQGELLYLLSGKDLILYPLDGGEAEPLSSVQVGVDWTGEEEAEQSVSGFEKTPLAVYPAGDRLAVVYDWYGYSGGGEELTYTEYTAVDIFDVSDPRSPSLQASFGQDGTFRSAGLFDGTLYVISDYTVFDAVDPAVPESFVPRIYTDGAAAPLEAEQLLLPANGTYSGCAVAGAYGLETLSRDVTAVLGAAPEAYAADGKLFFLVPRWAECPSRVLEENGRQVEERAVTAATEIYRFSADADGISLESTAVVNGHIPDSSALDLRNGVLRYAAVLRQGLFERSEAGDIVWRVREEGTRLAALDGELRLTSVLDRLPDGQPIRWAGFLDGSAVATSAENHSYLVDLTAPQPEAAALADPIRAEVILPWGDSGYMAFYRAEDDRLTLSVRDADLRELAVRSFGSDHSNTLESRECYLSDAEANILSFAADDSYCIYGFDPQEGLVFRKGIYLTDFAWNCRAFRIGERLYVANPREVFVFDAETLEQLDSFAP